MTSPSEAGQTSEGVFPEIIKILLPLEDVDDVDVMSLKSEEIKSIVASQKINIEKFPEMMYEVAKNISSSFDDKDINHKETKMKCSERFVIIFEAVVDGLQMRKLTPDNVMKVLLTNKHNEEGECFTVLSLAFKHKLVKIIKKLFELLTFEIASEGTADPKRLGVIINGVTPMTLRDLKSSRRETKEDGSHSKRPCLEYLGHDNEVEADILDVEPVRLVESVYNRMTTIIYIVLIVLHTMYMSLFSYSSMYLMDKIRNQTEIDRFDQNALVFYIVLPIEPLAFIICYATELSLGHNALQKSNHPKLRYIIWKCSPWAIRLVFSILVTLSIVFFYMYKMILVHNILSITLMVGWLTTISFTEGVKPLRVFWRMIVQMISIDVYKILLVYAFVLISFSFALHIQFQLSQAIIDEYPTPFHTMFLFYQLMLGNGDLFSEDFKQNMKEGGGSEGISIFLFVAYSVMATLVLINLLIAMMNKSYEEILKELKFSRRIASLKRSLILENIILKICGYGLLGIFWKKVFKKGCWERDSIKAENKNAIFWYVEVNDFKDVDFKVKESMEDAMSEDGVVKLIQKLNDETQKLTDEIKDTKQSMIKINQKLDILCDKVTRTSAKVDDEHTKL